MVNSLSSNEYEVFNIVFSLHDPDIRTLCSLLSGKLTDKNSNIVSEEPDTRYVSKLKSTGLKKIHNSLMDLSKTLRIDIKDEPKKYIDKIKACIHGLHFVINTEIFLIYTLEEGPIVWYKHNSTTCEECNPKGKCSQVLELIIHERKLEIPNKLNNEPIDKKADWVFQEILK